MPMGFLVRLGNGILNAADVITGERTGFNTQTNLGAGSWTWSGINTSGGTVTNQTVNGTYHLATDGSVYFVPNGTNTVGTLSSATVTTAPAYDDRTFGTGGANTIQGDGTFEVIYGGADTSGTSTGSDTINAGAGNDQVFSGDGNDLVRGGGHDDTIQAGAGDDTVYGDNQTAPTTGTETLNWIAQGASGTNIAGGFTQDTGGMRVTVDFEQTGSGTGAATSNAAQFVGTQGFATNSSLQLTGNTGTNSTVSIVFDPEAGSNLSDEVSNVLFRLNDIDTQNWIDLITIRAWNAQGQPVSITLTASGNDTVNSANGTIVSGAGMDDPNQARGSVLVSIAGPVHHIEIVYTNGGTTNQWVWMTNMSFTTLAPADGADTIDGGAGADLIYGGGANDSITGGADNDSVFGGAGNDRLFGDTGDDSLTGDAGDDTLDGDAGNDRLFGGDGNDSLIGDAGDDVLDGGANDDTLSDSAGANTFFGGAGRDTMFGGIDADLIFGGTGDDSLSGNGGSDSLAGEDGNDTLSGGGGADILSGGADNDTLLGDAGADTLSGDAGNDSINGGDDADRILVGPADGVDTIAGGEGGTDQDTLAFTGASAVTVTFSGAEAGSYSVGTSTGSFTQIEAVEGTAQNDTLNAAASTANQSLYGGGGADSVSGGSGNDTLDGGTGNDTLTGGAGNDSVQGGDGADRIITGAADGTDTIAGGEGPTDQDTLAFTGASAVSVTFSGAEAGSYSVGTSTGSFTQIEAVEGTAQNDTLNAAASTVNQSLYGGGGADSVSGGSGNDTLDGGTGNDTLTGGAGNDSLQGGDGADRIIVSATDGVDQIAGGEGPTDQDTLDFFGTGSATVIFTGNESGTYSLGSASGSFSQIETVEGTEQGDTLNAAATTAGQTLAGFGGDDTLTGGAGSDSLSGGTGNDTLTGGAGADVLDGGAGLDLGDYSASDAGVQIDLSTGSATGGHAQGDSLGGIDGLVGSAFDDSLTGYDADSFVPGNTFTNIFFGGAGNDSLSGRGGSDSLYGGADNDTIFGGTGNDLLDGGTGNDRLDGGAGNDSLTGNAGDDRFVLADGFGTDTVLGGETAETGGDVLDASGLTGDAVLDLSAIGPGNPEDGLLSQGSNSASFAEIEAVILGAGNDSIIGSAGADSVMAGLGADTLDGGAGNDRFDLGADSDQDLIIIEDGDGQDLILNFAAPIDNGGGNFTGRDLVDVSGLTDTNGDPVNVWDVTVSDDGSGNAVLTFPNGEALRLIGVPPAALADPRALIAMGIPGSDGTVAGTVGDDLIDAAYLGDPDGDRVDAADNLGSGGANDDLIAADAGNDTVLAGDGDDTVWAGTGNDSVLGGAGNDIILGDLGDDRLSGGSGDDYIDAGPGADTLWGDGGNDTLYAGAGSQLIFGGADDDLVSGGLDADTIQGDSGNDNLSGDQGDDLIDGGDGDDALMGGSGGDSLLGGTGADYLDGGTGNDRLDGGTGADSLLGNAGDDRFVLTNSHGDDSLSGGETAETTGDLLDASAMTDDVVLDLAAGTPGDPEDGTLTSAGGTVTFWEIEAAELGAGNDTVIGSAGSDRVDAGAGNDVMTGGAGADSLSGGTGNDRITFGQGDSINAGTGDDLLTLADHAEPGSAAITLSGGDGIDSLRLGQLADLSTLTITSSGPNGLTGTVVLDDGSLLSFTEIENIICFTPGTLIATPRGARRIEDLAPGDLVVTRDHGLQPVRWIGQRTVAAEGRFAPIRLRPGTLMGLERDLVVSPQHRMLFQGYRAQLLFGDSEVLVPALHLVDGKAVTRDEGGEVTYVHLLFDQHEVIFAEGTATESFHPGDIGLSALDGAAREELFALFPELRSSPGSYGDTARRCLKRHEALLLRV